MELLQFSGRATCSTKAELVFLSVTAEVHGGVPDLHQLHEREDPPPDCGQ